MTTTETSAATDIPDDDPLFDELVELTAFLAEHVDRIPRHRRAQAVRQLERVETLLSDPTKNPESAA